MKLQPCEYLHLIFRFVFNSHKCNTYIMFKSLPKHETYLCQVKNRKHRIALTKLRVSHHKHMIEEGREKRPIIYLEERKCPTRLQSKVKNTLLQHVCYIKLELNDSKYSRRWVGLSVQLFVYKVWLQILLVHVLKVRKKLLSLFGSWSFDGKSQLKMADRRKISIRTTFFKYSHVIYHCIQNCMLIKNHITTRVWTWRP